MKVFTEAEELGEFAAEGGGVSHAGDLVGGDSGGVGLESEMNQLVHGANVLLGDLVIGVEFEAFAFFVGQSGFGDVDPGLGLFDILFHLADGVHVFVELLLVVIAEFAADAVGIIEDEVEEMGGTFESAAISGRVSIASAEETFEDAARLIDGRDGAAVFVVGKGAGTSRFTHSAIGGHDEGAVAGLPGIMLSHNLVHGLDIPQVVGADVPTCEESVATVVSANLFNFGVGESAQNGEVFAVSFQGLEAFVEYIALAFTIGEPVPFLFVFLLGERDSEGEVDYAESGRWWSGGFGSGHAVEHGKCEAGSRTLEESSAADILSPHHFVKKASLVTMLCTSDCSRRSFSTDFFANSSTRGSSENSSERPRE